MHIWRSLLRLGRENHGSRWQLPYRGEAQLRTIEQFPVLAESPFLTGQHPADGH
jgi:hypothetical protein